ncbi:hypothetical protein PIGHUM_03983 [Pigmentiphaga humi]|uniref:Uncharacterized protein n=1 Tax=Pigmentiphaga humi TaxID=2478468 RepID=A0A3P4B750_9BURK|nr:hypothetical protein [Pigmentiphaga humi]VCU71892.1 hypothetical protein PIGHUM_03983 [Pigmentiphaga humi]
MNYTPNQQPAAPELESKRPYIAPSVLVLGTVGGVTEGVVGFGPDIGLFDS